MLSRFVIFIGYLVVCFFLLKILEFISPYEGIFRTKIINPAELSISKLLAILNARGIYFREAVEKRDLIQNTKQSGQVTVDEVQASEQLNEADQEIVESLDEETVHFLSSAHFHEIVEDNKDSVWVIQTLPVASEAPISSREWVTLKKSLRRFGIRTGIYNCSVDNSLCLTRRWIYPRVLLALPQFNVVKSRVQLDTFTGELSARKVLLWIYSRLNSRVMKVTTKAEWEELMTPCISCQRKRACSEFRSNCHLFLFLSSLDVVPLLLSALSVRFTGRMKFAMLSKKSRFKVIDSSNCVEYGDDKSTESVDSDSNESKDEFGQTVIVTKAGCKRLDPSIIDQGLTFHRMHLFLRTIYPETNDFFISCLIVINLFSLQEFWAANAVLLVRLIRTAWCVFKFNFLVFSLWLPVLWILNWFDQSAVLPYISYYFSLFLQLLSASWPGTMLRSAWQFYCLHWWLVIINFFIVGLIVVPIQKLFFRHEQQNLGSMWNYLYLSYYYELSRHTVHSYSRDEESVVGLRRFIDRMATPDIWLHPAVSTDYIYSLPTWVFQKATTSDQEKFARKPAIDDKTGSKTAVQQTDNMSAKVNHVMDTHYKCQCQKNRSFSILRLFFRCTLDPKDCLSRIQKKDPAPPKEMIIDDTCSICLNTYANGDVLSGLPCHHTFHKHCIVNWLSMEYHTCPICRSPTFKEQP